MFGFFRTKSGWKLLEDSLMMLTDADIEYAEMLKSLFNADFISTIGSIDPTLVDSVESVQKICENAADSITSGANAAKVIIPHLKILQQIEKEHEPVEKSYHDFTEAYKKASSKLRTAESHLIAHQKGGLVPPHIRAEYDKASIRVAEFRTESLKKDNEYQISHEEFRRVFINELCSCLGRIFLNRSDGSLQYQTLDEIINC